jgi:hypothetical protein
METILNCALYVFAAIAIAAAAAVLIFPLPRAEYDRGEWDEYMEDDNAEN